MCQTGAPAAPAFRVLSQGCNSLRECIVFTGRLLAPGSPTEERETSHLFVGSPQVFLTGCFILGGVSPENNPFSGRCPVAVVMTRNETVFLFDLRPDLTPAGASRASDLGSSVSRERPGHFSWHQTLPVRGCPSLSSSASLWLLCAPTVSSFLLLLIRTPCSVGITFQEGTSSEMCLLCHFFHPRSHKGSSR